ncbi:MAG: site-specific tyrosine recombinase XerD [Propionibacteriaceae bacterium]|nr:site-specific tyrosine recombinase XerD [Propionibacteriaceae bacterium]
MPTPLDSLIATYLDHLQVERGMSRHTIAGYRRDLGRYAEHLAARGITDPHAVTAADITDHAVTLGRTLAPASVARATVAVRSLHRFAVVEGLATDDPAAVVKPPPQPKRLPKALPLDQVQALLTAPDKTEPAGLRDAALLELLYGTGARISEIVALDVDDLGRLVGRDADPAAGLRLVGKGDRERIVPLGSYARAAVDAWLVRGRESFASRSARANPGLFLNGRGGRLSRQSAWALLRAYAEKAGITAEISPHTLRHSYATHLLDGGADVRVVQELLGHASVTTTQIYTMVTVDHLRETYLTAHPRAY